jgi:hypothetical protein
LKIFEKKAEDNESHDFCEEFHDFGRFSEDSTEKLTGGSFFATFLKIGEN